MSKYADVIKEARKPESQKASLSGEGSEPDVNLSIKVPKSLRRHWAAEAKRQDTTVTAAIIEALKARFGEPG
jgi:hypothetical protein